MTKMTAMASNNKTLENLLLQNEKAYDFESIKGEELYKVYINHDPGITLILQGQHEMISTKRVM